MREKIKAVVFTKAGFVDIGLFPVPKCENGHVLCETHYSVVSTGTELRVLRGEQQGGVFPLIPGYSWVGRVIETGPDVKTLAAGDWVSGRAATPLNGAASLWGGHAEIHNSPATGYAAVVKLPDDVEPWEYILTEVAAISWRGVSMTCPAAGETVLVVGQGLIGALAAKWLLAAGTRVIVMDMDEKRLERARQWGAWTVSAKDSCAKDKILALSDGGVDIAVEASANLEGARFAASALRPLQASAMNASFRADSIARTSYWPRLCLLASYTRTMEMKPTGLVEPEGAIVLFPTDRRVQDRIAVIEKIRNGLLRTTDIVDAPIPAEQAPEVYKRLRDEPGLSLTAVFKWR